MDFDNSLRSRYAGAMDLMSELDRLRRAWMTHHPSPPLTRGGLFTLMTLDKLEHRGQGPGTPSQLAAALKQSAPVVSQRLRSLEEGGYLERTAAESDRRVAHLKLTDKGRDEAQRAVGVMMDAMQHALDSLEDDGAQQLLHQLRQLNHFMENFSDQTTTEGGDTPC